MDPFFVFFQLGPALQFIFKISYITQRSDFKELTTSQYQSMDQKLSEDDIQNLTNQKVFAFIPDDPKIYNKLTNLYGDNLLVVGDREISAFESAYGLIESYCNDSGREFESLTDKLVYMAQTLPDVFSEGTPYGIHGVFGRTGQKRPIIR